jgi:hypothetical protein
MKIIKVMTKQKEHKCSECGGLMEEGFIIDRSRAGIMVSRWLQGTPERYGNSLLGAGIASPKKNAECRYVQSFRCHLCGFLKQYALERAEPPGWGRA